MRRRRPKRTSCVAYRIHVEEIPQAAVQGTGIRVALKLDLPMYVATAGTLPAALSWSVRRAPDGTLVAQGRNGGGTHAQVRGLEALDAAGRPVGRSATRGVVLPNSMREWNLGRVTGEPATIVVTTPAGEQRSPLGGTRP
jgi:fimbrial chaperone protein